MGGGWDGVMRAAAILRYRCDGVLERAGTGSGEDINVESFRETIINVYPPPQRYTREE